MRRFMQYTAVQCSAVQCGASAVYHVHEYRNRIADITKNLWLLEDARGAGIAVL